MRCSRAEARSCPEPRDCSPIGYRSRFGSLGAGNRGTTRAAKPDRDTERPFNPTIALALEIRDG